MTGDTDALSVAGDNEPKSELVSGGDDADAFEELSSTTMNLAEIHYG